jgi:ferric-dicitrate binding protein FerR (iron transport regulator)
MSGGVKDGDDGEMDRLAPLSDLARAWAEASPQSVGSAGAWAELDAGLVRRTRVRRAGWALASALTLALGTVAGRGLWLRHTRLTFAIEGADARTDGYIPRVVAPLAQVRFSDGTEVGLEHGSRAWVVSTGADGAQLRLEDGRAHFAVVHRPHAHWSVEAGPFVVSVTGTKFDVEWSGANDLLRVHLRSGVVTVGGPQTRGGVTLLPGQVLEARPDEGILRVEPAPAETAAPSTPHGGAEIGGGAKASPPAEPVAPAEPAASAELAPAAPAASATPAASAAPAALPPTTVSRPTASDAPRPPEGSLAERKPRAVAARPKAVALVTPARGDLGGDWRKEIASGEFQPILAEAEARGMQSCLRSLPSDRLAALGDAARYAGQTALASRVLQAQRARFPGSPAAAEATFLLGRLAEDAHEPSSAALPWYELYLTQAPSGAYAAEALGRQMLILGAQERGQRAREAARKYLEAYPRGAYVTQARQILEDAP